MNYGCKQFESKIRLVPHLFVFACSFRDQNLLRASFASSDKNEFVSSGTCWGFRAPIPSNHSASFAAVPACGSHSFDFLIKRKMLISPNNIQTGQPKLTRIEKCAIRIIQCKSGLNHMQYARLNMK